MKKCTVCDGLCEYEDGKWFHITGMGDRSTKTHDPKPCTVTIEQVESFLWSYFGERFAIKTDTGETYLIQDMAPELADFLHKQGVAIDWSDGSRYASA